MARLIAVAGPIAGLKIPLPDGEFTSGRDPDNTLCVEADDRLSRRHVLVRRQDHQVLICDLSQRGHA